METNSLVPLHRTGFLPAPWPSQMMQLAIVLTAEPDRIKLMEQDVKDEPFYRLICKRLELFGIPTTIGLRLYLTVMLETPGEVSIYVHSLWHLYAEKQFGEPMSVEDFLTAFADGFPSKEHLSDFWDKQKTKEGKNLVDQSVSYQRF